MQFLVYSVWLWWLTHHYKVFKYFLIMIMIITIIIIIIIIIVIISLISFFFQSTIIVKRLYGDHAYTTRNINTLINECTVWPTKKVFKIYKLLKKIIFSLNSLYCPVIINKILTVIKDKKPISWLSIGLITTYHGIKKCDNHTV